VVTCTFFVRLFLRRGNLQFDINSILIPFKLAIYDILSDLSSEPEFKVIDLSRISLTGWDPRKQTSFGTGILYDPVRLEAGRFQQPHLPHTPAILRLQVGHRPWRMLFLSTENPARWINNAPQPGQ
jgi:hypothetical protein